MENLQQHLLNMANRTEVVFGSQTLQVKYMPKGHWQTLTRNINSHAELLAFQQELISNSGQIDIVDANVIELLDA